jgi:hypothetical protein
MNNSNDKILIELIQKQLKNIPSDKKLSYNDLKRISKYLSTSIFMDSNDCSFWNGYVTVLKNDDKNSYINFYFNGKKHSLHRLLYLNFIGDLDDSEYIKFKCSNKGKCCKLLHFYKNDKDDKKDSDINNHQLTNSTNETNIKVPEIKKIIVGFG